MSSVNLPGGIDPASVAHPKPGALPPAKTEEASGLRRLLANGNFRDYGLLIALAVIMLFFEFKTGGVLFQPLNLTNLILQNSYVVVMALGMLLIIVAGHIDLSIGSIVGFVGALAAVLMVQGLHLGLGFIGLDSVGIDIPPMSYGIATVICLIVGGLVGAAQGYFVAYFGIPSFIVTLAGMLVFRGLTLAVLNGASVSPFPGRLPAPRQGLLPQLRRPLDIGHHRGRHRGDLRRHQLPAPHGPPVARRRHREHAGLRAAERLPGADPAGFRLPDGLLPRPAQRPHHHDGAGADLPLRHEQDDHRAAHLRARRQRQGGAAVRHQDRPADLPDLRQHGRAGRPRRHDLRRPGSTPRRRRGGLGFELDVIAACFIGGASASGRRRQGHGRRDRRLHHRGDETTACRSSASASTTSRSSRAWCCSAPSASTSTTSARRPEPPIFERWAGAADRAAPRGGDEGFGNGRPGGTAPRAGPCRRGVAAARTAGYPRRVRRAA